jgi:hypothetical protein
MGIELRFLIKFNMGFMNKYIYIVSILFVLLLLNTGCAANMNAVKPCISPNTTSDRGNNLLPNDRVLPSGEIESLANFIFSYNKYLSRNDAYEIATAIVNVSNTYKVNYKVIAALVAIESRYNTKIKSPSGAMGLGQLMPATARTLSVNNPFDTLDNLDGTVRLVRNYLEKFDGDINFALGAYKKGCGSIEKSGISQASTIDYIQNIRKVFDQIP